MRTRERRPELMDRLDADPSQLDRSLVDLDRVNSWLGGRRTAVRLILEMAEQIAPGPVTVIDVGTGGADIPRALVRQASLRGLDLRVTATDIHPRTLDFARKATAGEKRIEVVRADALALPFEDDSFDLALCCTTLHHFSRSEAGVGLRELDRVAKHGLVVTDLARSWFAVAGADLLAETVWRRHPITKHDGPVSVRAAFTPMELAVLAEETLTRPWRVRSHALLRLSLVAGPGRNDGPRESTAGQSYAAPPNPSEAQ